MDMILKAIARTLLTWQFSGAGGARTHDLTDYESAALTS